MEPCRPGLFYFPGLICIFKKILHVSTMMHCHVFKATGPSNHRLKLVKVWTNVSHLSLLHICCICCVMESSLTHTLYFNWDSVICMASCSAEGLDLQSQGFTWPSIYGFQRPWLSKTVMSERRNRSNQLLCLSLILDWLSLVYYVLVVSHLPFLFLA